jgi:hypothetical protein
MVIPNPLGIRIFGQGAARLYGEVWGVGGKGDRKPLGVRGWPTTGVVGAELLGTAVVALGIQFGAAPPHTHIQKLD